MAEPAPVLAGVGEPAPLLVGVRIPVPGSWIPAVSADRPDHERSLVPVDAIDALELDGIAPVAMELDAPASLEPLVLTELVLEAKGDQ